MSPNFLKLEKEVLSSIKSTLNSIIMTQQELQEEQNKTNLYGLLSICEKHDIWMELNYNSVAFTWHICILPSYGAFNYYGELDDCVSNGIEYLKSLDII